MKLANLRQCLHQNFRFVVRGNVSDIGVVFMTGNKQILNTIEGWQLARQKISAYDKR
jgi:hypothetical protein